MALSPVFLLFDFRRRADDPERAQTLPFSQSRINFEDPLFITTFTAELWLASERRGPPPEKAGVRLHAEPRVGALPENFNWSSIVQ